MIPFILVSGFLGSGKTSFLKTLLEKYGHEKRLGIIQNEFAPGNVDGTELKNSGKKFELLEVNRGSVFCICLIADFIPTLHDFIEKHKPDIIILEASGLADPINIGEMLQSDILRRQTFLSKSCCIVDAQNYSKSGKFNMRLKHQIMIADQIIINKIDLNPDYQDLVPELKKINPFAKFSFSSYCKINDDILIPTTTARALQEDYSKEESPGRPDISTCVIKNPKPVELSALKEFLNKYKNSCLRIKGFIQLKNGKSVAIQGSFGRIEILETEALNHPGEMIAMGDNISPDNFGKDFRNLSKMT